jgi:N-acyl-D-amino-acid deacylase
MDEKMNRRRFLKKTASVAGSGLVVSQFGLNLIGCSRYDFDIVIENGLVFDGLGKPPVQADVGVIGELIAEIGNLKNRSSKKRIPASGLAVSPGFIDIHTHTDTELLTGSEAQSKIRQGVTTEMSGQCGGSVAPRKKEGQEKQKERMKERFGTPFSWVDFDGFYRCLSKQGITLNWMTMVGQGTLRDYVIGMEDRPATENEISQMQQLARDSLNEGVWGISSGLEYTPSSYASLEELTELCSIMGGKRKLVGIYATHMRNEDETVEEAVEEALKIGELAKVGVQISHLKSIGKPNWPKLPGLLKMIDQAREKEIRVTADRYPYSAYSTNLEASLFPLWTREGGTNNFIERLQNSELIGKIREEVQAKVNLLNSWSGVLISNLKKEENDWMKGKRVSEIAAELNQDPFETVRQLLIDENSGISICGFGMDEENTKAVLKHPMVAIGSDGSSLSIENRGNPHPRNFGTFPRVLGKYAREEKIFPLEEAVRKMTYLPATILGIPKRGLLQPGFFADIAIFDPDKVTDTATWENPKSYPVGIPYVLVNGDPVIFEDEHTGNLPGKVLTRKFNPL